jgi:hypothetical protein
MRRQQLVLAFLATAAIATDALGQQMLVTRVKHDIACPRCTIQLTKLISFGSRTDPVFLDEAAALARDSKGRYYVAGGGREKVVVYDSAGRYVKSFGRRGVGPGEFEGIGILSLHVGLGDTLFVQEGWGRVSVFSANHSFVRSFRAPSGTGQLHALSNDSFLASGTLRDPAHVGLAFHILDRNGQVSRSFGDPTTVVLPGSPRSPALLALSRDRQTFWTQTGYRLEQWTPAGRLLASFEVYDVPWLPPPVYEEVRLKSDGGRGAQSVRAPTNQGNATITGVDGSGMVWLYVAPPLREASAQGRGSTTVNYEVFDPSRGRVFASITLDQFLYFVPGTELVWTISSAADGTVSYTIWKMRIQPV